MPGWRAATGGTATRHVGLLAACSQRQPDESLTAGPPQAIQDAVRVEALACEFRRCLDQPLAITQNVARARVTSRCERACLERSPGRVMTYARCWHRTVGVIAALGVGVAMLEWSPPLAALALVIISGVVALIEGVLANELVRVVAPPPTIAALLARSLVVGSAAVSLMALVAASPPVALLFGTLATVTSPWLIAGLTRRERASTPPPQEACEQPTDVSGLDDEQLCHLWRDTFWDLHEVVGIDARLRLVALREACLQEMEKRNPDALTAWLESGGRASGNPERFWRMTHRSEDDPD
jgi:hypothetical protein